MFIPPAIRGDADLSIEQKPNGVRREPDVSLEGGHYD
jgi:hypothetical protein